MLSRRSAWLFHLEDLSWFSHGCQEEEVVEEEEASWCS